MPDISPNLLLPYLTAGQAQKHITVNESLQRLDALVQLAVASATVSTQPGSPADGQVHILPPGKTGANWAAMADQALAYYRDGAWEQISPREGWLAYVKDADLLLCYNGVAWTRLNAAIGAWRMLAASAVAVTHTGNTSETTLATVTIPAGAMGPNGLIRVEAAFSFNNNANNKTAFIRFGGASGTAYLNAIGTTQGHARYSRVIANRNSASAQVGAAHNNAGGWGLSGGSTITTGAINTASAVDLLIRGQLANAADTITLESYMVEMLYGA